MVFSSADTSEEICLEIGRRLALIRLSIGLSQENLAVRSGVAKRTIERLERGAASLRIDALVRVCLALGRAEGFEQLLPKPELGPLALANGEQIPMRARKRKNIGVRPIWKEDK